MRPLALAVVVFFAACGACASEPSDATFDAHVDAAPVADASVETVAETLDAADTFDDSDADTFDTIADSGVDAFGADTPGDADASSCSAPATFDIHSEEAAETICEMRRKGGGACHVCVQSVDDSGKPTKWMAIESPESCGCPTPYGTKPDASPG